MLCWFRFFQQLLKPAARVAAGTNQVLFGVRQFILVQRDLRPQDLSPLLQAVLLLAPGILGWRGKLLDLLLTDLDLSFGLPDPLFNGAGLGFSTLGCRPAVRRAMAKAASNSRSATRTASCANCCSKE
jgi:hypothetical protein